ncbi:ABC transporter permease [Candidatus Bipolaricaulota bacterium]|nr:ABC transporter permease [Candidatus Bipolaricaulota bacterium]
MILLWLAQQAGVVPVRKFIDFLQLAGRSIIHRRMRSWLTVIGVFIGITAVVALISIGLGLDKTIKEQVSGVFGVDNFIIMNESTFGPGAHGGTADEYALDLDLLKSIEGVKVAAALRERTGFVQGQPDEDGNTLQGFLPVMGLSPELMTEFESFTGDLVPMPGGRLFEPGDVEVAVLDYEISQRLGVGVGDTILVAGDGSSELNLTIIGIMAPPEEEADDSGGGFGMQFSAGSDGSTISVPYDTMDLLWGPADDVLVTLVRTEPGYDVDDVADRAEDALNARGSEISAVTYADISSAIGSMMTAISGFLAGIAGISLLVGGVGVMNTMFTSVLERTKEIGVMKAVGAKNSHVWTIFLIESGMMGLVGGIVGTLLGLGLSAVASSIIGRFFDIELIVVASPMLIIVTLFGSFALGAFAGLWPAWRASRLPVVDALRYE